MSTAALLKSVDFELDQKSPPSYTLPEVMDLFRQKRLTPVQCVKLCDEHELWPSPDVLWINFVQGVDQSEAARKYWEEMALRS